MSLEALQFGLADPLQANVIVKPYDAFALFVDSQVLQSTNDADQMKKAVITQTLNEFQKLVKYYRDNGALTTFYLADTRDPSVASALASLNYGPSDLDGWSIMWIRGGGRLEDIRLNFSGGISAAGIDDMLRTNPNHDPAIDIILAYSSLDANNIPVQTTNTYTLFTDPQSSITSSVPPPTAPTAFTVSAEAAITSEQSPTMMTTVQEQAPKHIHWVFLGLLALTGYMLFARKPAMAPRARLLV